MCACVCYVDVSVCLAYTGIYVVMVFFNKRFEYANSMSLLT